MDLINTFDSTVINFIQEHFHSFVTDAVFIFSTNLGEYGFIWILSSVIMLFFKKSRRCGFIALVALLLSFLAGEVLLKNIICRPRPFMQAEDFKLLIPPPSGYSFPSGHSASSFTAATVYYAFNKKIGRWAFVLATLIAFSRVFLYVHFPTDILAGAALGIGFALLSLSLAPRLFPETPGNIKEG